MSSCELFHNSSLQDLFGFPSWPNLCLWLQDTCVASCWHVHSCFTQPRTPVARIRPPQRKAKHSRAMPRSRCKGHCVSIGHLRCGSTAQSPQHEVCQCLPGSFGKTLCKIRCSCLAGIATPPSLCKKKRPTVVTISVELADTAARHSNTLQVAGRALSKWSGYTSAFSANPEQARMFGAPAFYGWSTPFSPSRCTSRCSIAPFGTWESEK